MDEKTLLNLLNRFKSGELTEKQALAELKTLPYEDLGFANVDHHRAARAGFPEVVMAQFKTPEETVKIVEAVMKRGGKAIATRADAQTGGLLLNAVKGGFYDERAKIFAAPYPPPKPKYGKVAVVTAGTSDIPVAREASVVLSMMECETVEIYDVGVAGVHRLLDKLPVLTDAKVVVAVAGMEGALPSVIKGLIAAPVIAAPTSVGYGASFGGVSALLSMLNSCASGVAVVNIDNGFGAGFMAGLIARLGRENEN